MTSQAFNSMIKRAHQLFTTTTSPRGQYGHAVIDGRQNWSGSDLQGMAKKYPRGYGEARVIALHAIERAGGTMINVECNRLCTALPIGMDDYGNALFETRSGVAVQHTRKQARHY